jgi:hypothetical protein
LLVEANFAIKCLNERQFCELTPAGESDSILQVSPLIRKTARFLPANLAAAYTQDTAMMQSMMTSFKRCLGMDFSDQASREIKDAGRDNARALAARYSRGSVRIQAGAFVTNEDIESERVKAREYKFSR